MLLHIECSPILDSKINYFKKPDMSLKEIMEQLNNLCSIPSVTGNEKVIMTTFFEELKSCSKSINYDNFGNLVCEKGKSPSVVAVFAHVDKVGFMVSKIDDQVHAVGLSKKKPLPEGFAAKVKVLSNNDNLSAVIKNLGEGENELVLQGVDPENVTIGDFVAYSPNFLYSAASKSVISQGLDNKLGVLAAIEAFKQISQGTLVLTVQEESGSHGAKAAISSVHPEKAVVVDVTMADDPETSVSHQGGVSFCIKDKFFANPDMLELAKSVAVKNEIPYQLEVLEAGGSDVTGFYAEHGGIPHLFVGIPISNMHTPNELMYLDDLISAINFMKKYLSCLSAADGK